MRTLLISDLHLGSGSRADLLRSAQIRAPLMEAVAGADRVVLLGDVLELRHGPVAGALAAARPFFEDLGRALGDGEVVICQGNHDHGLLAPWLSRRKEADAVEPLGLEQRIAPADASLAVQTIAQWLSPASAEVAYPGLWVRPDVYAMHGHYLDCHLTIPTLERLGIGAMCRVMGRSEASLASVEDHEMVGDPLFSWIDAVARQGPTGRALDGSVTVRVWHALGGTDSTHAGPAEGGRLAGVRKRLGAVAPTARRRAVAYAFPLAVAALNRAGMGPLETDISRDELRRAGLRAMGEVASRVGLGEAHVIFGHTHRAGPRPDDDPGEWRGRAGASLWNTGCWTYERAFLGRSGPDADPYWPGGCVAVEDSGPPQVLRLLAHLSREQLRAAVS